MKKIYFSCSITGGRGDEAIYAAITKRYGARKLVELQDMLGVLESSLLAMEAADEGSAGADE